MKGKIKKMNTKDRKEKEKQATKVLYMAVAGMLVVMALIVTLSSVLSRTRKPTLPDTTLPAETVHTTPDTEADRAPDTETDFSDSAVTLPTAADTDEHQANVQTPPSASVVPTLSSPVSEGGLSHTLGQGSCVFFYNGGLPHTYGSGYQCRPRREGMRYRGGYRGRRVV